MSSLASAPEGAAPGAPRAAHPARLVTWRTTHDAAAGVALAIALTLLVFLTGGGTTLAQNTWAEIVLVLAGGAAAVLALLLRRSGPRWGGGTLLLFGLLVAFTGASVTWSVKADDSWLEANRALAYLAVLGGAILAARLCPGRWRALVGGLGVVAVLVSLYALLVKVFPATLDPSDPVGRLRAPFDYWNATGLIGALGLLPVLWAGSRPDRGRIVRGLAPAAVAVLITVVVLSYSRSALLAAVCAVGLWFCLVPLRLRAALVLALGGAGGAILALWALHTHALSHDNVALAARSDAGHGFGLLLVLVLLALVVAGLPAAFAVDRVTLRPAVRRRVGVALLVTLACVPVAGIGALAASSRGLTGQISHAWSTLTDPTSGVTDTPGRLTELGNSRPRYWSEGLKVGEHAPLVGVGAAGYDIARTRYSKDGVHIVAHAHSYIVETFADLGAIGLALNLALLMAWALATSRTLGWGPLARRQEGGAPVDAAERIGMLTLLCVVIGFGVQSAVDWTWSIPGNAIPALLCAGWLVGRGPLSRPAWTLARRRRFSEQPALGVAVAGVAAVTLVAGWLIWQPQRSTAAGSDAVASLSRGDSAAALSEARTAQAANPLSATPLWELADVYTATGQSALARDELTKAISLQPQNPQTWRELGFYDLAHGLPRRAVGALNQARKLAPEDLPTLAALAQARAAVQARARTASSAAP